MVTIGYIAEKQDGKSTLKCCHFIFWYSYWFVLYHS